MSGGGTDNALTVGQTFAMPSAYKSKRRLLKAQTEAERSRLEVTRNEMRREVSLAYYRLEYMRERLKTLQAQDSVYSKFMQIANAKLGAGETGQLETMNVRRMRNENLVAVANAAHDVENAAQQLRLWLNADSIDIAPESDSLQRLDAPYARAIEASRNPEADLLAKEVSVSERNLKDVKQGWFPTVSLSAGTQLVMKGWNPYGIDRSAFSGGNFTGFEIGLNIPLAFGTQKAKVRAAQKEVELASANRESRLKQLESQCRAAANEYLKAKSRLEYYDREGLKQLEEMQRISRLSYENGSIGYVELIENMRAASEMRMDYITAIDDCNRAVITLNYLKGDLK